MTVLIVDRSAARLLELSDAMHRLYPDAHVFVETDPQMAGKFSRQTHVDLLLAAECGEALVRAARMGDPAVRIVAVTENGGEGGAELPPGTDGCVDWPAPDAALRQALAQP